MPGRLSVDTAPDVGQLVRVRGQQWVVSRRSVSSQPRDELAVEVPGRTLVTLTSVSDDDLGNELTVAWEIEPGREVLPETRLPQVTADGWDDPQTLGAVLLDAVRWGTVASADDHTLQAPFRAGITIEWTGLVTTAATRLTSAAVVELIGQAAEHVLLVGYAVHNEPTVTAALDAARARGVTVTLVLERHADNPQFTGATQPFPDLDATRLCWPHTIRPPGASLHAKLLVIDNVSALIGSANITGAALGKNLECGLLIRGGDTARSLRQHISLLIAENQLEQLG